MSGAIGAGRVAGKTRLFRERDQFPHAINAVRREKAPEIRSVATMFVSLQHVTATRT